MRPRALNVRCRAIALLFSADLREGKMKFHVFTSIALSFWLSAGAGWAQAIAKDDAFGSIPALLSEMPQAQSVVAPLTLEEVERIALQANPEIEVAARRVSMARAHVPIAGALDDPMAMYRGWGVPLKRPWDYNAAQNMFSLSQTFVSDSKRNLRTSVAEADVDQAQANLDAVRLDLQVRVRKAFFDLLLSEDQARIHAQHVAIAQQAIGAARIKYTAGGVPQPPSRQSDRGAYAWPLFRAPLVRAGEHRLRARLEPRWAYWDFGLEGCSTVYGQLPHLD